MVSGEGEKIDDKQFGFRKQRNMIDAISKIKFKILDGFEKKRRKQLQSTLKFRNPITKSTEIKHMNN